jgi:hypothetical protein
MGAVMVWEDTGVPKNNATNASRIIVRKPIRFRIFPLQMGLGSSGFPGAETSEASQCLLICQDWQLDLHRLSFYLQRLGKR